MLSRSGLLMMLLRGHSFRVHDWWSRLQDFGLLHGYYLNALKTWLIVKPAFLSDAQHLFDGTGVQVTVDGN